MKPKSASTWIALFASFSLYGQGVFIDDQFSTTTPPLTTPFAGNIQGGYPFGQSFTPTFDSVGFVRLNLCDQGQNNGFGATAYVVLHADSITGSTLGTSGSVAMGDNYVGAPDFIFATPVAVSPGVTYYFQIVIQLGGDSFGALGAGYNYPGGSFFVGGQPGAGDLWFHEGIVVPEPASAVLILLGGGFLIYIRRCKQSQSESRR